jgi:hypothetical protein
MKQCVCADEVCMKGQYCESKLDDADPDQYCQDSPRQEEEDDFTVDVVGKKCCWSGCPNEKRTGKTKPANLELCKADCRAKDACKFISYEAKTRQTQSSFILNGASIGNVIPISFY